MHKISLSFDLYRLYDRVYDGVLVHLDGYADLEDILQNDFIFNKNFTINNFHFNKENQSYIQRIRADENKIIQDVESFLTPANIKELFFETLAELGYEDSVLNEFDEKYFAKFYPN